MGNYTYSETTPGGEFRNKETNELKPPAGLPQIGRKWNMTERACV